MKKLFAIFCEELCFFEELTKVDKINFEWYNKVFKKISEFMLNLNKILIVFSLSAISLGIFPMPVKSLEQRLEITNIRIFLEGKNAIISWDTNLSAIGKIEYGLTNVYGFSLEEGGKKKLNHSITLINLIPERTYHYKISARSDLQEVSIFDAVFKTKKFFSDVASTITQVSAAYVTGTTATIQWLTDKPATTQVSYGFTKSYGMNASSGAKTTVHDIALRNLKIAAVYHYQVKSVDSDGNISVYNDQTFQTNLTGDAENLELEITNIRPITSNDEYINDTTAIITWKTNKLTDGAVYYGTTDKLGKTFREAPPRDFFHNVTLSNLKPATLYYFKVESKDVFGKKATSNIFSFQTQYSGTDSIPAISDSKPINSEVSFLRDIPTESCDTDSSGSSGFYGMYYNLTEDMPDMGKLKSNEKIAEENGWYDDKYFSFSRIDKNLEFGGKFFPVNEGKAGDPFYFAVHWKAVAAVPKDGNYVFSMTSDDDSWLFIDNKLEINNGGIHGSKKKKQNIFLSSGYHTVDIYFAERARGNSYFTFIPDSQIIFSPPAGVCRIEEAAAEKKDNSLSTPRILGAEYNPSETYTKVKSLVRVQGTPDVYAIMDGKRHYVSGPTALRDYGLTFADVKAVSQKFLDAYPYTRLLRTPDNPTVYFIYHRPDKRWLKIAIPTPSVFVSYPENYWGDIVFVHPNDIRAFPDAKIVKSFGEDTFYLLEGGVKRPFASRDAVQTSGYHLSEVVEISPEHLEYFPSGKPIL